MTIGYVGKSAIVKQSGSSSPAVFTYPTVGAGNLLLLVCETGDSTNGTVSTPSGWDLADTAVGGGGTWGAGTGPRRITVFSRESDGTESGTFNVTWTSGAAAVFIGQIYQFSRTAGAWAALATASGDDATSGGTLDVTTASLAMAPDDMIMGAYCGNGDSFLANPAIAASGITFGTYTEQTSDSQTGGNRMTFDVATGLVSSGTATAAVSLTLDIFGDPCSGLAMAVRLREAAGGGSVYNPLTGRGGSAALPLAA